MTIKQILAIIFSIFLLLVFFIFINFKEYFTINSLLNYYEIINSYIEQNFKKSILFFILSYSVLVILNFPLVSILSLAGGLFFGTWVGGVIVVIAATLGSSIFFIIAKYFFYNFFKRKVLNHLIKFENHFKRNEFSFLLVLRIMPGLPFIIQTLIASCLGANNIKFFLATFLGIMPVSFIITSIGNNMHNILLRGDNIGIYLIYEPQYLIPILLLLLFVILGSFLKNKLNKY